MPTTEPKITLRVHNAELLPTATVLAKQLSLPYYLAAAPELKLYEYCVDVCSSSLSPNYQLGISLNNHPQKPLFIDFTAGKSAYRREHGGGRQQSIARAVGIKPHTQLDILDVTAGLGQDAFVLASLGCKVRLLERSPLIAALLGNALQRATAHPDTRLIAEHMTLIAQDAISYLSESEKSQAPDVIYVDPMYPHRSKSALVKKSMRLLRGIVGNDEDSERVLEAALKFAQKRVVVKRPKGAPTLGQRAPSHRIEDQGTRFDVYMIHHPDLIDQ